MAVLKKKQLAHIEKRLLEERGRALRSLGLFDEMAKADRESGDSDLAVYTDHMADQGTEAMEREKAAVADGGASPDTTCRLMVSRLPKVAAAAAASK